MLRLSILSLALALVPSPLLAQTPSPTRWFESVLARVNGTLETSQGMDHEAPEALQLTAIDLAGEVSGQVAFGPSGAPQGRVSISALTGHAGATLSGSASITIRFQFRVVETSPPSVGVSDVPIAVTALGNVTTSGSEWIQAQASASIDAGTSETSLIGVAAFANNDPVDAIPESDAFGVSATESFPVGVVLGGTMTGFATVSVMDSSPGEASAAAFIDPDIRVADEVISGSSDNYRDHFTIEFGPGYYALGDPTPVAPTTWGTVKTLFD